MEYGGELMSRKANLLKDYLAETEDMCRLIDAVTPQSFDFADLQKSIDKREVIISKIKEIDGILNRRQFKDDEDIDRYKWLCDKLIKQIVEAEDKNRMSFKMLVQKLESAMQNNSTMLRGISTYLKQDEHSLSSQEWKK